MTYDLLVVDLAIGDGITKVLLILTFDSFFSVWNLLVSLAFGVWIEFRFSEKILLAREIAFGVLKEMLASMLHLRGAKESLILSNFLDPSVLTLSLL